MSIRQITKEQLRRMGDREGLVLQGCGGDPQEWLDGINEILTNEGILKKGAGFEEAYTFQHDGLTCLLFPFKEIWSWIWESLPYGGWLPILPSVEENQTPEEIDNQLCDINAGFLAMEATMADDKLCYRLGSMNMTGTGTEVDLEKSRYYFEKAVELGSVDALYGLGKL